MHVLSPASQESICYQILKFNWTWYQWYYAIVLYFSTANSYFSAIIPTTSSSYIPSTISYSGKYLLHCPRQQYKSEIMTFIPERVHSISLYFFAYVHMIPWRIFFPVHLAIREWVHSGFHFKWNSRSCTTFHSENELRSGLKIPNLVAWDD